MQIVTILNLINNGFLDESLDTLIENARARKEVLQARKALSLDPGAKFTLTNISPKNLDGAPVEFIKHDGNWLECKLLMSRSSRWREGSVIRVRASHVGVVLPKHP